MRIKSLVKLISLLILINLPGDLLSQQMNGYSPKSLSSNEYDLSPYTHLRAHET